MDPCTSLVPTGLQRVLVPPRMDEAMKTTIERPEALLEKARRAAARRGTTLNALLEAVLRRELQPRSRPGRGFRLRDASFTGRGLQPGAEALCSDHGLAELWSADRDFGRFPELTVRNPLIESEGKKRR